MVATSIGDVQIVSVAAYAPEQADYFDGMPELRVRPDGAVPDPAVAELLADFGALGMSPVALLAPDPP